MGEVIDYRSPEVNDVYLRMKKHSWPTDKYLKNTKNIKIQEISAKERFLARFNLLDIEKLYHEKVSYNKGEESFIYRELVKRGCMDEIALPAESAHYLMIHGNVFTYESLSAIIECAVNYLTGILYDHEPEFYSLYPFDSQRTMLMGLVIEAIGRDDFAREFLNGNYTCVTNTLKNVLGLERTIIFNSIMKDPIFSEKQYFETPEYEGLYLGLKDDARIPENIYDEMLSNYKYSIDYQDKKEEQGKTLNKKKK